MPRNLQPRNVLSINHDELLQAGTLNLPMNLHTTLTLPDLIALIVAHYAKDGHVVDPASVRPKMHEEGFGDECHMVFDGFTAELAADVTVIAKLKKLE